MLLLPSLLLVPILFTEIAVPRVYPRYIGPFKRYGQAQALFKEASRDGRLLHALEHTLATGETAAQPPAVEDVRAQAE
eukprot:4402991-Amphidinium_carterae.1